MYPPKPLFIPGFTTLSNDTTFAIRFRPEAPQMPVLLYLYAYNIVGNSGNQPYSYLLVAWQRHTHVSLPP